MGETNSTAFFKTVKAVMPDHNHDNGCMQSRSKLDPFKMADSFLQLSYTMDELKICWVWLNFYKF